MLRDSKDRTSNLTASLTCDCVAARRASSSAAALLAASNSAARFASSAWSLASVTGAWASRSVICFVGKRGLDGRSRDKRGIKERCLVRDEDPEGTGGERRVGRGGEDGRGAEEEEGLRREDDDEVEIRSEGRDPLARGSPASRRLVSTLGSGRGGSGRRGDFEGSGSRGWTTVAR